MPVCQNGDININYKVYGDGFPIVLSHAFTASLEMWTPQIKVLSPKYQVIVYDIRGFGLSSAPAGEENYTLDLLAEDLHSLVTHLGIEKAYIGGLSLGGAVSIGYAARHPEKVAALLIFDIHGGFQPPADPAMRAAMAEARETSEKIAMGRGMADLARLQLAAGTAFPPAERDEILQEQYIRDRANCPVNGFIGVGRAVPWETAWQREAADNINVPTLITVGSDDMIKAGVKTLHEHIKGSRYVEIKRSVHGTAVWRPDAFNQAVLEFLQAVEEGKPIAGEITLD